MTGKFFRLFGNDLTLKGEVFNVPDIITKKEVLSVPIKISYIDSMNNYYSKEFIGILKIKNAQELGKSDGYYILWIILILVIIAGIGYCFYIKKRKRKEKIKI